MDVAAIASVAATTAPSKTADRAIESREQPACRHGKPEDREKYQANGKLGDPGKVPLELAPRKRPRCCMKQWRKEHEEHDVGVEIDPRHARDQPKQQSRNSRKTWTEEP